MKSCIHSRSRASGSVPTGALPAGIAALLLLAMAAGPLNASTAAFDQAIGNALQLGGGKYGQIKLNLRYRYEYVDQDGVPAITKTARASTLRIRLGYLTPGMLGFKVYAEYEGLEPIFNHNQYNDSFNGNTQFPKVADPSKRELNQLWLSYAGIADTLLKAGRQRIAYDDHRFIGNVPWRQLEQTFDGGTVFNQSLPDTTIQVAYIAKVRDVTSRNVNMHSPLLNIRYEGLPYGKLIGYGYWLNYDDAGDSRGFRKSSQTYGLRFTGLAPVSETIQALYTAEWAHQWDFRRNPQNYDGNFVHLGAGIQLPDLFLPPVADLYARVDWELLGSDNDFAFQTPLATLHKFQGWADQFLFTPADGISDLYGSVGATVLGTKLLAVFHDFNADKGNDHYGNEIDALIGKKFGKHTSVLLKYAHYNASKFAFDTEKFWVQMQVQF